ncbi:FecCD family ABC transporter permease [Paenibacillus hodogayensis]|uniref:FecCD family ABC transporter permease n=1 Tax=Paenibacillus hodogayensis TaxID=279208 RepID=A0ABV5W2G3_9BACL
MNKTGSATRYMTILGLLLAANVLAFTGNIVSGERAVPLLEAIRTAAGFGSDTYEFTIRTLRMPRALVGLLAGAALALSGVILQAITRNPLASPGVMGLNAGAGAAAVAVIVMAPTFPTAGLPFVAFGGALLTAAMIYAFSWRRGSSPIRMLLVGIGISAIAGAVISYLLSVGGIFRVSQASVWLAGSLYGRGWEHVWPLLPWLVAWFPVCMLLARHLDAIQLGDEMATGVGLPLERSRGLLVLVSVGLAGAAVSMVGTVGFIGLMAPHLSRHLVGNMSARLLPAAALMGGLVMQLSDLVGRTVFAPFEIPVGIVTALLGAPYMIYLLYRPRHL